MSYYWKPLPPERQRLADAFRFFHEHAGYVVGESAVCAIALARAEQFAREHDLTYAWEPESEPWDGCVPLAPTDCLDWVACRDGNGEVLASVGMVATTGYSDPYRRVLEAELALEAMGVLDERDDSEADKLARRATYAGVGA